MNSIYHNNSIATWLVSKNGKVDNVEAWVMPYFHYCLFHLYHRFSSKQQPLLVIENLILGQIATDEEAAGWDIDVRPDGLGAPHWERRLRSLARKFMPKVCAACHGDFGEGALTGGLDLVGGVRQL